MRDLDLTSLRLFVTVCDTGNMSRAAEKANMVASAVSKRLAQLEATVGASLLTRRKHGVVPTAAGETLLEHARSMLLSASRIEDIRAFYEVMLGLGEAALAHLRSSRFVAEREELRRLLQARGPGRP